MKQRTRKKPLYRRILEAKLAEILGLMKKIATTLPEPAPTTMSITKFPASYRASGLPATLA